MTDQRRAQELARCNARLLETLDTDAITHGFIPGPGFAPRTRWRPLDD